MSGSTSVAVSGGGGDAYRAPFTAVQWQELEHQALIYKYLVAGVPVPSDLVVPIRRSLEAISARFFHHPTLSYCSYYGKKFDPEPGRCRRTDGKKWRCSKDAHHESKYCERHMHRGRNRSRKPVESQSTSQSLSTAMSHITTVKSTASGKESFQNVSSTTFPNQSVYPITNSESYDYGNNMSKLEVDTSPYMFNNKGYRYGSTADMDDHSYVVDSSTDNTWRLMRTQVPESSMLKPRDDSYLQDNSLKLNMVNAFEPMIDSTCMSKKRQQHCFFGSEIGSPNQVKHERPLFDEWSKAKEPWSDLDATTQLSISMASEFNSRNACSPNDA